MQTLFRSFLLFSLLTFGVGLRAQSITGFTLVNATTDEILGPLTDGMQLDVSQLGNNLTVLAEVEGTVGSIRFGLNDTPNFRIESTAPYSLSGDTNGDYGDLDLGLGDQVLYATAFTGFADGDILDSDTIRFSLVDMPRDIVLPADPGTGAVTVSGELKKWHKVTLSFDGPAYREVNTGLTNPFLDLRLDVTFTQGADTLIVPGYFAADGNAAETSADSGNVWRCHFAPPATGEWNYTVDFRLGEDIAVVDDPSFGTPITPLHGQTGSLTVGATDKVAPDNRARGRLDYVGEHYLQYQETGEYFVKGGPDSPENFLAYDDFDNTPNNGDRRKSWMPHVADHAAGDPTWQGDKGRGIIGAVNYLASKGLNAFSFLTMNVQGDDDNVFPYVDPTSFAAFDCSKLDQWEIVFNHADQRGMYLHFKTQETENDGLLDDGEVGRSRKLYYRQLIARFGHHLALNWNMGEENTQTVAQRRQMAEYFAATDPYGHHRVIHTFPRQHEQVYAPLLGDQSLYTGPSIQTPWDNVHRATNEWVRRSAAAGKKWVVANDEQGSANIGVPPDTGYEGFTPTTPDMNGIRQQTLWGNLMAGGAGVEYYFGYQVPQTDLSLQDYRSRDQQWEYVDHALTYFRQLNLPEMTNRDDLVGGNNWCLANEGLDYVVYLPAGGSTRLRLYDTIPYTVSWYNPRTGATATGSLPEINGPGDVSVGTPPAEADQDWAVRIFREPGDNAAPVAAFAITDQGELNATFDASESTDEDGSIAAYGWDFGDGTLGRGQVVTHEYAQSGAYLVTLTVTDNAGGVSITQQTIDFEFNGPCGEPVTIFSRDFDFTGTRFYLDNFTGQSLLAINAEQDTTAEVTTTFNGATCLYDLTFHGVGESDGQSSYKLFVNDDLVGDIVMPLSSEPFEFGQDYNLTFRNVSVPRGAEIRVFAKVGTDGMEFSRARWLKIDFDPVENPRGCLDEWNEDNGLIVIEMENGNINQRWRRATAGGGFSGTGYIEWTGNEFFSQTGNGVVTYPLTITRPGTYTFDWRVRVGFGSSNTEHNDTWWRVTGEGATIFAEKPGDRFKPRPQCTTDPDFNCPEGASSNGYFKVYVNNLNWQWRATTSDFNPTPLFVTFDEPGRYNMQISARSSFHRIDRAVFYHSDLSTSEARSLNNEESQCQATDQVALNFVVSDGFNLFEGATVAITAGTLTEMENTGVAGDAGFSVGTGTYEYTVMAPNRPDVVGQVTVGSDRTVLVTLPFITSVEDARPELMFSVFPNPASDQITVLLPAAEDAEVSIYDAGGRQLRQAVASGQQLQVQTSDLAAGIYLVRVRTKTGVGTRRVVVR